MIERDYIMRMIKQLAGVLARIIRAKEQEQYDEALQLIQEAYSELFGLDSRLAGMMDAESLALLLGNRDKIKAMARLFREEGDLQALKGDASQAGSRYKRSLELYLEATAVESSKDPEVLQAIQELAEKIDIAQLSGKYSALLKKVKP